MGKKSECIRVPILLRMDNPRHQLVYNILENVDNKSAYIREAVIYYYRHNGISMKSDDILDDIRNVIQECKEELLIELENVWKVIDYDKVKSVLENYKIRYNRIARND